MRQGQIMTTFCLAFVALLGLSVLPIASTLGAQTEDKPVVVLETNYGPFTLQLDRVKAPLTVENFMKYVDSGFFDNTCFHRCIPDFMIQGGGFPPNATGQQDAKKTGAPVKNEAGNGLKNQRGTIAMARTGDPNSATAQFFVYLKDNSFLDRENAQDGFGYTVFGKVTEGMDTVEKIAKVQTVRNGLSEGCPVEPVVIKSAKRKKAS
jgi:cyclophilin family peptidyl-prolyl cis-trans isomerase